MKKVKKKNWFKRVWRLVRSCGRRRDWRREHIERERVIAWLSCAFLFNFYSLKKFNITASLKLTLCFDLEGFWWQLCSLLFCISCAQYVTWLSRRGESLASVIARNKVFHQSEHWKLINPIKRSCHRASPALRPFPSYVNCYLIAFYPQKKIFVFAVVLSVSKYQKLLLTTYLQ